MELDGGTSMTPPRCQYDAKCTIPPLKGVNPFCRTHSILFSKMTHLLKARLSGWETIYMPSVYNDPQKLVQSNHNCFAYAFDILDLDDCKPTDDSTKCRKPYHQPGYFAGHTKFTDDGKKYCPDLIGRLLGDMPWIKKTKFEKKCPQKHSKIALVIDPDNDYHFYRQDRDGFWSHKPGGQPVTNLDAVGKRIYNPELANRDYRKPGSPKKDQLNYSIFCSFLCIPRYQRVTAKRGGGLATRKRRNYTRTRQPVPAPPTNLVPLSYVK
jgi:hypothetical protein